MNKQRKETNPYGNDYQHRNTRMQFSSLAPNLCARALLVAALVGSQAFADDVEIYTDTDALGVNPNVLFVIDTSGSMGGTVDVSVYNAATVYTTPAGSPVCLPTRLYVGGVDGISHPACDTDYWFDLAQLTCGAAEDNLGITTPGTGTGFYNDKFAQWDTVYDGWYNLDSYFDNYRGQAAHYECEDDYGDHGENAADPNRRIRNGGSGPFSNSGQRRIWRSKGTRTVFSSNYLTWYHYHGGSSGATKTRLEVVVDAAKDMIDSVADMNIGLMRFDNTGTTQYYSDVGGNRTNNHGGPVSYKVLDVSPGEETGGVSNKQVLKDILDTYAYQGSTPLTETVYEGMRYYRGQNVFYGLPQTDGTQISHSSSRTGNTYDTPIEFDCQSNYMVVFSDGEPTADHDADSAINNLIDGFAGDMGSCDHDSGTYYADDSCLDELSNYMFTADHSGPVEGVTYGNDLDGLQNITSYYISGFDAADDALMNAAAQRGGTDQNYSASNPSEFAAVFNTIISQIQQVNASFTSPAVSVNALNRLRHNNDLYFALFEPSRTPHWNGNLKKYRLEPTGVVDADGEPELMIADSTSTNAIDTSTGLFEPDARSYWQLTGANPDGDETARGGAAYRLFDYDSVADTFDASTRANRVYTFLTDYAPNAVEFDGSGVALTTMPDSQVDETTLSENGTDITAGTLGLPALVTRPELLDRVRWIRGEDALDADNDGNLTEGRPVMGGILHTEPILINYTFDDNGTPEDTSDDVQENVILATTNDGYFHIFDTVDSGDQRLEHSAIVPKKTLGQMEQLYLNGGADIAYRLDSNIDVWRFDGNNDEQITTGGSDFVYAYFGQRRGGNAIFAFDITDTDYPELLWQIDPDTVVSTETDPQLAPFKKMGQSWSRPRRQRLLLPPTPSSTSLVAKDILIFGGGYDPTRDDVEDIARDADQVGNAIYIVDAKTGELIWWASNGPVNGVSPDLLLPEMDYGFASNIRIVDVNGDSIADKIFASDGGGQVWRFDINNTLNVGDAVSLSSRMTGGVIADLQMNNSSDAIINNAAGQAKNRRLYYAPDVAIIQEDDADAPQLSITIGSGYRAHPLNKTINDKFFVLKYDDVLNKPADGVTLDGYELTKLYVEDLLDITTLNFSDQTVVDSLSAADSAKVNENGWFLNLTGDGEKSLSESITVDGFVVFTTYTPPGTTTSSSGQECGGNQGVAKTYVVSVFDGAPVANLDGLGGDTNFELTDRVFNNKVSGIAPKPKTIFPDIPDVSGRIIVGRELLPLKIANAPDLTYWVQE